MEFIGKILTRALAWKTFWQESPLVKVNHHLGNGWKPDLLSQQGAPSDVNQTSASADELFHAENED